MGWAIALSLLAVLYVFNKRVNPRRKGQMVVAVLTMIIAAGVGVGFAYTVVGEWTAGAISWAGSMFGSDIGLGISIGLTVLATLTAVADIAFDRNADKAAQFAAILMPTLLLLVVGGSMGKTGGDAVKTANTKLTAIISTAGESGKAGKK